MRNFTKKHLHKAASFLRDNLSRKNENFSFYLLILISLIVFVAGINFFVELTDSLSGTSLKSYDRAVTDYIISFRTPGLTSFFQVLTDAGDFYGYLVATALATIYFFLKFKNWKIIIQLLVVTILASLSNIALKRAINRQRPEIEHLVVVETLSYPSGHSMSAMAFYGFLIYLCFRIKMNRGLRAFLVSLFVFLILGIGISRIYLGVHFPSDVLGGFTAGLIWVAFCVVLFNLIDLIRKRKQREKPVSREELAEEEKLEE